MARIVRITGGFLLIVAGIFMLVLPGPGILSIVGGLALLSRDLPWADRLAARVKEKVGKSADSSLTENTGP
jgi:hypothetical protein